MNRTGNDRYDDLDQSFEPSNDAVTKHIIGLTYSQSFFDGKMQNIFFAKDYVNHPNIRQTDQSTVTGSDQSARFYYQKLLWIWYRTALYVLRPISGKGFL